MSRQDFNKTLATDLSLCISELSWSKMFIAKMKSHAQNLEVSVASYCWLLCLLSAERVRYAIFVLFKYPRNFYWSNIFKSMCSADSNVKLLL